MSGVLVLADESDVRGFALAGAGGRAIEDGAALARELENVADASVVLVSAASADRAARALARVRGDAAGPIVLVLPETGVR